MAKVEKGLQTFLLKVLFGLGSRCHSDGYSELPWRWNKNLLRDLGSTGLCSRWTGAVKESLGMNMDAEHSNLCKGYPHGQSVFGIKSLLIFRSLR